jgi:hypothetical protein
MPAAGLGQSTPGVGGGSWSRVVVETAAVPQGRRRWPCQDGVDGASVRAAVEAVASEGGQVLDVYGTGMPQQSLGLPSCCDFHLA